MKVNLYQRPHNDTRLLCPIISSSTPQLPFTSHVLHCRTTKQEASHVNHTKSYPSAISIRSPREDACWRAFHVRASSLSMLRSRHMTLRSTLSSRCEWHALPKRRKTSSHCVREGKCPEKQGRNPVRLIAADRTGVSLVGI